MNWYPPALSISLDSEEEEGRVQWMGLECRVRCGICGVLCMSGEMWCKVWDMECCEVWNMWSAVWHGITCGTGQSKH